MEGKWPRGEIEARIGQGWKARDEREKRERVGKDEVGEKEGKGGWGDDESGHAARQHTHGTLFPERSGKGQWAKRGGRGENRGKGGER